MQAKTIRNIIIVTLLVFVSVFVVYCTNTKDNNIDKAASSHKENIKQETTIKTENLHHSNQSASQENTQIEKENTQIDKEANKENPIKTAPQIQPINTKETQNKQTDKAKSHNKTQTNQSKDKQKSSNNTANKQNNKKETNKTKKDSKQTNDTTKTNMQQENTESNQNKQQQNMQEPTQNNNENKDSKENKNNDEINEAENTNNNETNKTRKIEKNQNDNAININENDNVKEKDQEKQDKNNTSNTKVAENKNNEKEQTNTDSNKEEETKENIEQTDNQEKQENQTGACIVAPSCNNPNISRQLAITSLDLHANVRAKEEERIKGQSAGEDFMRLWKQTRGMILPKLTSHVSNIYDQGTQENGKSRTCTANYYTEVLEDFGNGWRDKKGDKSPIYKVTYSVSCKNLDTAKLTIIEEKEHNGNRNASPILIKQDNTESKQIRIPPACNDTAVYNQLAQAGFYAHAMARAQEEGRIRGQEAQQKFMQLWDKTQSQVISKLTSHVSNIRDQGIQANKQIRTCVANYYTEVIEDFGNGWRDKKGDKSPIYIVYYSVAYLNNEDDLIKIKITAQNRIR